MIDDKKKVGIGLVVGGLAFSGLGILLFLNSRLISIGNAMFMSGLCFIVGIQGTLSLFTRYVNNGVSSRFYPVELRANELTLCIHLHLLSSLSRSYDSIDFALLYLTEITMV